LAETLVGEYDVALDNARQDVTDFLEQLEFLNALETRGAAS